MARGARDIDDTVGEGTGATWPGVDNAWTAGSNGEPTLAPLIAALERAVVRQAHLAAGAPGSGRR